MSSKNTLNPQVTVSLRLPSSVADKMKKAAAKEQRKFGDWLRILVMKAWVRE